MQGDCISTVSFIKSSLSKQSEGSSSASSVCLLAPQALLSSNATKSSRRLGQHCAAGSPSNCMVSLFLRSATAVSHRLPRRFLTSADVSISTHGIGR